MKTKNSVKFVYMLRKATQHSQYKSSIYNNINNIIYRNLSSNNMSKDTSFPIHKPSDRILNLSNSILSLNRIEYHQLMTLIMVIYYTMHAITLNSLLFFTL